MRTRFQFKGDINGTWSSTTMVITRLDPATLSAAKNSSGGRRTVVVPAAPLLTNSGVDG
jgi:hypothetical protein